MGPVLDGARTGRLCGACTLADWPVMNSHTLPSLAELQAIHAEWMAFDSASATPDAINELAHRFTRLIPGKYLNVSPDGTMAGPIEHGMPCWAEKRPIADAIAWAHARHGYRLDVAWCGHSGQWVPMPALVGGAN